MDTLTNYVVMFSANFVLVFLLGLQSKNVMHERYISAMLTSFGISGCNFLFVKFAATGSYLIFAITAAGGCLGIACSIWFYQRFMERKAKEKWHVV